MDNRFHIYLYSLCLTIVKHAIHSLKYAVIRNTPDTCLYVDLYIDLL